MQTQEGSKGHKWWKPPTGKTKGKEKARKGHISATPITRGKIGGCQG